jgi:hypothetical protein
MFTFDDDDTVPKNYVKNMVGGKYKKEPSLMELVMYFTAGFMLFSSLMHSGSPDKWFSRLALSVIAIGFAGVMREIRKSRK